MRLCLLLFFSVLPPLLVGAEGLHSFSAVRALPAEEATRAQPVTVEATVVGADPASPWNLFLHDGGTGCYVKVVPTGGAADFPPGTRLRVEGVSMLLGYYPSVGQARVTKLGTGPLPPPIRLSAEQLFAPEFDSAWVEVPALIVGYEIRDGRVTLDIDVHGLPFKAELPFRPEAEQEAAKVIQRQVRLRGVLGTIFNRQRQMTDRHFFVASFDELLPTTSPAAATGASLIEVAQVLTGGYGPLTPIRVRGVVTQTDPKGFYLRDASGSTLVYAARGSQFPPGTTVEIEGFGRLAPFRPVLRASRVDALSSGKKPAPVDFDFEGADLPITHSELVTLPATFLTRQDGRDGVILECQAGAQVFEALLKPGAAPLPKLSAGDRVRLRGICELTTTHALPRVGWVDGFRLHLPDADGLEVISRAPWWNPQRLLIALGLMSILAVLGLAGTWVLRVQVGRQMKVIGQKLRDEAAARERERIARDLHDTLEQQLSGVALQLDALGDAVTADSGMAKKVLGLAKRMLRHTRLEARRSVLNLRSEVLEKHGFAAAVREMAESSATPNGPRITMLESGSPEPLPAVAEFHLFRIAQEALANALKHAEAREIVISLEHSTGAFHLQILDDGRGFDPSSAGSAAPGPHLGLLGMRDRAAQNGAELTITAAPGAGCRVSVRLPQNQPLSPA